MSTATNDVHYSFRSATSAKKSQRTASCRNETRKFVSLFAMSRAVASYLIQWRCRFLGINPAEARQRGYPMKDQSALADAAEGLTATPTGCCLKSVSISVRELSRQSSTPPLARFCFWWSSGFWKVVAVLEAGADADGGSGRACRLRRRLPVSRKNLLEEILHGDPGPLIGLLVINGWRRAVFRHEPVGEGV